jgi:hypothetical protein
MGTSTDAILFFGVVLPDPEEDDIPYPWKDEEDDDRDEWDFIAEKQGVVHPDLPYDNWTPEHEAAYKEYADRIAAIEAAAGCTVGIHCSKEYTMYYVAVKHREVTASRGYPEEIDPTQMPVLNRDQEKVREFLLALGYTAEQIEGWRIGWYLVSWWG